MKRAALFALAGMMSLTAGDWLNRGGDPQHSGWQRRGKTIGVGNAGEIKLLWSRKLEGALSAPVMLGPIVTHRGIKELVFVQSSRDTIYAVDADLGRVFWTRHVTNGPGACGSTSTPAMAPPPPGAKYNEDDDEGHTPMRPFYFVPSDGVLHTIRPADGVDMAPERRFVPAGAKLSDLTFADGYVYGTTSGGCGGVADGVWGIGATETKAGFVAMKAGGVSVGTGEVYVAGERGVVVLGPGLKEKSTIAVSTNGEAPVVVGSTLAVAGAHGDVGLVNGGKAQTRHLGTEVHGLAGWTDAGKRWIYAAVDGKIVAVGGWQSGDLGVTGAPVVANGVVYAVGATGAGTVLYALDGRTGKQLYASGDAIPAGVHPTSLGVANGHICFGTAEGTLYCFGLPIEIL